MNLLFKVIFGSRLYGTETADSDLDYKAVYAPSVNDMILGKVNLFSSTHVSNKKNQYVKSDSNVVETEYFTLQKFLKHLSEGQTIAVDMLYAPLKFWVGTPDNFWFNEILTNKQKFLSKNLNTFVKYAVKQAAKYGIKGSRLNTVNRLSAFLKSVDEDTRLKEHLDVLKTFLDDHCALFLVPDDDNKSMLCVCGKKFLLNTKVKYVIDPLDKFTLEYGSRARQAALDEGVDKKAISHAFRAAFEVKELVETRHLVFPLKDREFLKDVKTGVLTYNQVAPMLEDLVDEVKYMVDMSDLPDKPLIDADELVLKYYHEYFKEN